MQDFSEVNAAQNGSRQGFRTGQKRNKNFTDGESAPKNGRRPKSRLSISAMDILRFPDNYA